MTETAKKPIVKFAINIPKELTFQYDTGKEIVPKPGKDTWADGSKKESSFLYGVTVGGVESVLFATKYLNGFIAGKQPKGKTLKITKVQNEGDRYANWTVELVGGVKEEPKDKDVPF